MRVLITSSRAPATLEMARKFHSHGDEVFLSDSLRFGSGNFSRARVRTFVTPSPNSSLSEYILALNQIIKRERIELIVPTCEEIFFLASRKNQLDCELFSDSFDKLRDIHNKWTFSQTASNEFGRVPESFLIESPSQLNDYHHRVQEFVFKPAYSRFASETLVQPKIEQLNDIQVSTEKPWIAQKFIRGREYSTYSIARNGQLVAHCSYRSSFRAGVGSGICFRVEPHTAITEYVQEFAKRIEFTGQLGFDCIVDEDDQVWVIEGNPRATSGLHLFDNHSELIDAMFGRKNDLIEAERHSSQMVGVAMLSFGLQDAIEKNEVKRYLHDLFSSQDVLFRWSDPLPMLGLPLTVGELCWTAIRARKSLQQASTLDIEWNGEPI